VPIACSRIDNLLIAHQIRTRLTNATRSASVVLMSEISTFINGRENPFVSLVRLPRPDPLMKTPTHITAVATIAYTSNSRGDCQDNVACCHERVLRSAQVGVLDQHIVCIKSADGQNPNLRLSEGHEHGSQDASLRKGERALEFEELPAGFALCARGNPFG
jgi:hypothetical protein